MSPAWSSRSESPSDTCPGSPSRRRACRAVPQCLYGRRPCLHPASVCWNGPAACDTAVVPEAPMRDTKNGPVVDGEGWFVVNARGFPLARDGPAGRLLQLRGEAAVPELRHQPQRPRAGRADRDVPPRERAGGLPRAGRRVHARRRGPGAAARRVGLLLLRPGTPHIIVTAEGSRPSCSRSADGDAASGRACATS
jgi:hypothetical protein